MNDLAHDRAAILAAWQQHIYAEFVLKDANAALSTMAEHPYVLLVPSGTGGSGRAGVHAFYGEQFLPNIPPDFELVSLSRTLGDDRIVEEFVIRFTHSLAGLDAPGRARHRATCRVRLRRRHPVSRRQSGW